MAINDLKLNVELDNNMNIYATCKQFDDLNIILSMFKGGLSANLEEYKVRLKATKSDQVPLIQEHTGITISQNVVTITADKQLTNVAGNTVIEMQFIDKTTNKKKSTYNIILQVYNSTLEEDRSISKSTYTLLERLEDKLDQAGDFYENIDKGITLNDNLKNSINIGDTLKTNLDNKITTGSILNNDLETNISTGNTLKPNLEGAVTTANNVKAELDASIQNANKFASEHGDIIDLDNRVTQNTSKLNYNTQNIDDIRTIYYGISSG